ncbi:DUF481 domain-containing protein [Thalassotalea sp. Y01]|uniref:DUF481 domain-containing protein n=1 Tax=Thalassotalea sp. Y01 TaxID=2729613 RepID=UPI00145C7516|nr:DUF481 domain-containing protein [Thalassotalea sp. Y01]NMP14825.1 DUF481 domain-containing protein [Thalassotalea sp. Y01]
MNKKIPISLLALFSPLLAAEQSSNAEAIDAIVDALNKKDQPECYHFTDEVPPEEFIGFPECDLTPSKLTGSVEVGAFFNTSDNDYFIAKARSDLNHEVGKLRTNWILDVFGRKSEVEDDVTGKKRYETTDQKWLTSLQSNYTLEEGGRNYLFGYGSYEADRFNGFDYQAAVAAGWGRRWYETDIAYFDAEIGPGFKVDEIAETDDHNNRTETSTIVRTAATYERRIYQTMEFKQTLSAEIATKTGENSKLKSVSSVTTKLIESLALKFAFTVDHNTNVDGDIEKTRTETSLTLVYSI